MNLAPAPDFSHQNSERYVEYNDGPEFNLEGGYVVVEIAERNKQIMTKLAMDITTIFPVGIGSIVVIGNWAVQGGMPGFLLGVGAITMGVGLFVIRVLFGWNKLLVKFEAAEEKKKALARKEEIKRLNTKLKQRGDMEGHVLLCELNSLYEVFKANIEGSKEHYAQSGIVDKVEKLYKASVIYIERSYQLRKTANRLREGISKEPVLSKRKEILVEVQKCVDQLSQTVNQTDSQLVAYDHGKLKRLRDSIDEQLAISKDVADQFSEIDNIIQDAE